MKKLKWLYLVFAILFGAIGIIQCYRWSCVGEVTIGYFLNFLPTIAFFITYALSCQIEQKTLHAIAIPLCILIIVFWGVITVGVEMVVAATSEVNDVKKYEKILNEYWSFNDDLVKHFPSKIPPESKDVKFSFRPAFLQGGAHIQLRYTTTDEKITELYKHFSEIKAQSFLGGDTNDHIREADIWTTCFYTGDSDSYEFPDDFEIMVLHSQGHNHGDSCGVAISRAKKIIVYWAESW